MNTERLCAPPRTERGTLLSAQRASITLTLLNGAKFLGKILIGRCGRHLLESHLPAGEVFEPLVNLLGWHGQRNPQATTHPRAS